MFALFVGGSCNNLKTQFWLNGNFWNINIQDFPIFDIVYSLSQAARNNSMYNFLPFFMPPNFINLFFVRNVDIGNSIIQESLSYLIQHGFISHTHKDWWELGSLLPSGSGTIWNTWPPRTPWQHNTMTEKTLACKSLSSEVTHATSAYCLFCSWVSKLTARQAGKSRGEQGIFDGYKLSLQHVYYVKYT